MENLHVKIENAGNELVIREGTALPQVQPSKLAIVGNILAIAAFLSKRTGGKSGDGLQQVNPATAVVDVNREAGVLTLSLNPNDPFGTTVTGKLEHTTELLKWDINGKKMFSRDELLKLLKYAGLEFKTPEVYEKVLRAYQALNFSTSGVVKQESDSRGNKIHSFDKKVDTKDLPTDFVLTIPVFKGFEPVEFRVEICLEASDASIKFWFESVELDTIIKQNRDEIFNAQLLKCQDFVIIEK